MSKRPLELDGCPEVKKEAVEKSVATPTLEGIQIQMPHGLDTKTGREQNIAVKESAETKWGATGAEIAEEPLALDTQTSSLTTQSALEKEIAELRKENAELKKKSGENERNKSLQNEVRTLGDEVKRLQKHVAILKDYKRKYTDLKERDEADAEIRVKEKEKIKKKIRHLKDEKKSLLEEIERRGEIEHELASLSEKNEQLREKVESYRETRRRLNVTVEMYKASNIQLTRQLDWYKKGWLAYHEYADEQMHRESSRSESTLAHDSISMPPSGAPLTMPTPSFYGNLPNVPRHAHHPNIYPLPNRVVQTIEHLYINNDRW